MAEMHRHKVLCVDDERQVLEGLSLQLGRRYQVLTALSGAEALELLTQHPDVAAIVSDMRMPRMDGATFLVRARAQAPAAGRILLTGQSDLQAAIVAVNEAQVLKFLTKPCPPNELHAAVELAVQRHSQGNVESTGLRRALTAQIVSQDTLTGVASRSRFIEVLESVCAAAEAKEEMPSHAVLVVQIENWRDISVVHGLAESDQLLQLMARRLCEHCPGALCVARLGDDTFGVLQPADFVDETAILASADALIAQLAVPVALQQTRQRIRACVGIAGVPIHTNDAQTVVKYAGLATRQARLQGGGVACLFRADWAHRIEYRYQLLVALREAIEADALHLHYQPIIDARSCAVTKLEALARWQHPTLGAISPAQFINLAEESGDMPRLGQWILRRACREARQLAGRYCARVAVNVSMQQLLHDDFLEELDDALRQANLAPQELELELTESVFSRDAEKVLALVTALRQRGVSIAIDDFGTGYSSLAYLQRFPADALKVDRSFVASLGQGGETIVAAALSIGRSFGMHVVIEGVETELARRQLTALGAHLFQGYLYAKPMPLSQVETWFLSSAFAVAPSEVPVAATESPAEGPLSQIPASG